MNGYIRHRIKIDGKTKDINTARAIYESFCGPIAPKCEIDHWDGCRTNNRLSNLRAVTHKENMNNPITKARMSKPRRKLERYDIPEIIK